jgi:hypothetical protein
MFYRRGNIYVYVLGKGSFNYFPHVKKLVQRCGDGSGGLLVTRALVEPDSKKVLVVCDAQEDAALREDTLEILAVVGETDLIRPELDRWPVDGRHSAHDVALESSAPCVEIATVVKCIFFLSVGPFVEGIVECTEDWLEEAGNEHCCLG